MAGRVLNVEVCRYAKYITVTKNKITIPKVVKYRQAILYRSTSSPVTSFLVILLLAVLIATVGVLGPLSIMVFVVSLMFLWHFESRRRQREEALLRATISEDFVQRILDITVKICNETDKATERLQVDGFELRIRCGHPQKCIRYNRENAKKLFAIYTSIALALVLGYLFLPPVYLVLISIIVLFVVVLTYRIPLCEEFLVKKEKIVLNVED